MLNESSTKQIGGGGEADVYKAKLDGTWVALKVFKGNTAVAADQVSGWFECARVSVGGGV